MTGRRWRPPRVGSLTVLLVGAMIAVNVAGVWGIAVARRDVRDQTERLLGLETASRARTIESTLATTRADLAFLTGLPAFQGLQARAAPAQRDALGGALLLFLRGHAEIAHVAITSEEHPIVEAGRPRGVPGYWIPTASVPAESSDARAEPASRLVAARLPIPPDRGTGSLRVEARLDPTILLSHGEDIERPQRLECALIDGAGTSLAFEGGKARRLPAVSAGDATAAIRAEGWTAPLPWELRCTRGESADALSLEPLAERYRATILLNLAIMGLAVVLGFSAIQQARRRQSLEDRAREETRVRELERQLFHAERLSTVGRLAAGIAHEINNPLEGMSNYLRLAREALERGEGSACRRHLDRVQEGLRRAAGIVRRVLDHSDRTAPLAAAMDLNDVLTQSLEFVRTRDEFSAIRFELELDARAAAVRGSPVMLGQVFLNLLLNACEAQPDGGEVLVRSRLSGGSVLAEVADRGPGVAPADRTRIFEPFQSSKQSAGLGLFICHSIVQEHQGELSVEDRPGGGAIFTVRLAALQESQNAIA